MGYRAAPWTDRVRDALTRQHADLAYLNLGLRNLVTAEVRAGAARPGAAGRSRSGPGRLVCGGNDLLRQRHPDSVETDLGAIVASLRAAGADVVIFALMDIGLAEELAGSGPACRFRRAHSRRLGPPRCPVGGHVGAPGLLVPGHVQLRHAALVDAWACAARRADHPSARRAAGPTGKPRNVIEMERPIWTVNTCTTRPQRRTDPPPSEVSGNWRTNGRLAAVWDRGVKSRPVLGVRRIVSRTTAGCTGRASAQHRPGGLPGGRPEYWASPRRRGGLGPSPAGAPAALRRGRHLAAHAGQGQSRGGPARTRLCGGSIRPTPPRCPSSTPVSTWWCPTVDYIACKTNGVREMARVVRPGGTVRGGVAVRGAGFLCRTGSRPCGCAGTMRRVVHPAPTVLGSFAAARLTPIRTEQSGAILFFDFPAPRVTRRTACLSGSCPTPSPRPSPSATRRCRHRCSTRRRRWCRCGGPAKARVHHGTRLRPARRAPCCRRARGAGVAGRRGGQHDPLRRLPRRRRSAWTVGSDHGAGRRPNLPAEQRGARRSGPGRERAAPCLGTPPSIPT